MKTNNLDKGKFLQDFYSVEIIPALITKKGTPSKFAEAAKYWGEKIPTTKEEVKSLVELGKKLLSKSINESTEQEQVTVPIPVKLSSSWYSGTQELSTLKSNLIKVPFVKKGAWKHDVYGEVSFTEKDIKEVVTNYKNNVTGFTPYLTLGHLDEELNSTDSHRKRGDLHDILIEGDTTFGIFKVSDDIYTRVQNGEYEYSSGEFHRKFKDKESGQNVGTTVLRVALTNSPFLPFGNEKVQTLSNESENCPESKENYVFLLSLDTSNSDSKPFLNTEVKKETKEVEIVNSSFVEEDLVNISETTEQTQSNLTPNQHINKNIMSIENNTTEATKVVEVVETETVSSDVINEVPTSSLKLEVKEDTLSVKETMEAPQNNVLLNNLAAQLQSVQDIYSKQLESANNTILALTEKIDALTDKITGQEQVTQAFSNSMGLAQENAMVQSLQNNGVLPANIQRFLTLKNAFQSAENKNIVKFSVNVGEETQEVEKNVIDAIAELLISASNQTPLVEQQLGVSAGRRTGGFDFSSIIQKNQAAAEKFNSK